MLCPEDPVVLPPELAVVLESKSRVGTEDDVSDIITSEIARDHVLQSKS